MCAEWTLPLCMRMAAMQAGTVGLYGMRNSSTRRAAPMLLRLMVERQIRRRQVPVPVRLHGTDHEAPGFVIPSDRKVEASLGARRVERRGALLTSPRGVSVTVSSSRPRPCSPP